LLQENGLSAPVLYTDPYLETGFNSFYYLCDRDPTATELDVLDPANKGVGVYVNIPNFIYAWYNQVSNEIFWCTDNTFERMVWNHLITDRNLSAQLNELSRNINITRNYSDQVSPDFDTVYTPNIDADTEVLAIVALSSTLLATVAVNAQVNTSGDFITRATEGIAGGVVEVEADTRTLKFRVPAGGSYKLTKTGTASIIAISYLSL